MIQPTLPAPEGADHRLVAIAAELAAAVEGLRFAAPVTHVYNPLRYAWPLHRAYLERFGDGRKEIVLIGMNPGPWGMAQTGVPFGEVAAVRDFLGLTGEVGAPARAHERRPVEGLACHRSEVSGRRLWGWVRARFATPERFFARFMVLNYCPLLFLEESGRNRTPNQLPRGEQLALQAVCDRALSATIDHLQPRMAVGIGRWAAERTRAVMGDQLRVEHVLHPSPASPAANRGWDEQVTAQLRVLGVDL